MKGDPELDRLGEAYNEALASLRRVAPTVPGLPRTSEAIGGRVDAAKNDGLIREAEDELDRIDRELGALCRLWRLGPGMPL